MKAKNMNADDFVHAIKLYVRDTSISDTIDLIRKPPGRRPRKKHVELSNWFNQLSEHEKLMASSVIEEAVDTALFGLFCVLDGVRTIEDSEEKTIFQLYGMKGGRNILINKEDEESLHDRFNALTNPID